MQNWLDAFKSASDYWESESQNDDFLFNCCIQRPEVEDIDIEQAINFDINEEVFNPESPKKATKKSRKKWTVDQDMLLKSLVDELGQDWGLIAEHFQGKTMQAIEKRWIKLSKNTARKRWTPEQDQTIIDMYLTHGGNWKKIAEKVGRPVDAVKNRYYSSLKKKIPEHLRPARFRQPAPMMLGPQPEIVNDYEDVDSFFSFSDVSQPDSNSEPPTSPQQPQLSNDEKRQRLQGIYSKMARLEAFLNHTKQEIKKYEKTSVSDLPDIDMPNQSNSND